MNDETSDSEDDEEDALERLSANEAYLFPVIGSAVLGGLYLVFKYLGKEWINFIFGIYFALVGVVSVWKVSFSPCVRRSLQLTWYSTDLGSAFEDRARC